MKNSNSEMVKNLLVAAVGVLLAILLVMSLASFLMELRWT